MAELIRKRTKDDITAALKATLAKKKEWENQAQADFKRIRQERINLRDGYIQYLIGRLNESELDRRAMELGVEEFQATFDSVSASLGRRKIQKRLEQFCKRQKQHFFFKKFGGMENYA